MAITAAEVNKLRQQTGAGMMDCKKALEETKVQRWLPTVRIVTLKKV